MSGNALKCPLICVIIIDGRQLKLGHGRGQLGPDWDRVFVKVSKRIILEQRYSHK